MAGKKVTLAVPPPPLPPTAHPAMPEVPLTPDAPQVADVPLVDVNGVQMEAHPVGTAQYIAELETENAQALADKDATKGRAVEGLKNVAAVAITHAAAMQGYGGPMAGHLPQDINAIPGIDAINAAAPQ